MAMQPSDPLGHTHPASPEPGNVISPPMTSNGLLTPSLIVSEIEENKPSEGTSLNATWEMWDLVRSICDYNPRLTLSAFVSLFAHLYVLICIKQALDLSPALPTTLGVLSKWAAESVRHVYLPSSTFIANVKGYPVLPKPTQTFIRDSMIASSSSSSTCWVE